jgi:hypothetical protein
MYICPRLSEGRIMITQEEEERVRERESEKEREGGRWRKREREGEGGWEREIDKRERGRQASG